MTKEFMSVVDTDAASKVPAYWLIFRGFRLLVNVGEDKATLPKLSDPAELGIGTIRRQYLGHFVDEPQIHCFSAEVAEEIEAPDGMGFLGLRQLYGQLDEDLFSLAGRALQIVDWDRTHQYCSRCGASTQTMLTERAKECPQCGFVSYPRLSPAIIVRVTRKNERSSEILLGRSRRHPPGLYSVLAGFVEPGESLEECVKREVREEVGIEVREIRYFGSQPWPFPNSLMLAFTAEYAGGEIVLEEEEMVEAKWFAADALPRIPPPISIARQLIDDFVEGAGRRKDSASATTDDR